MVAANYALCWIIVRDTEHLVEESQFLHCHRLALQYRVVAFGRGLYVGRTRNSLYRGLLPTCDKLAKFLLFSLFAGFLCLPQMRWYYVNFRVLSQHLSLLFCKLKDVVPCLVSHRLLMSHVLRLCLVMLVCFIACDRLPGFGQAIEPI